MGVSKYSWCHGDPRLPRRYRRQNRREKDGEAAAGNRGTPSPLEGTTG